MHVRMLLLPFVAAVLLAAACGGSASTTSGTTSSSGPPKLHDPKLAATATPPLTLTTPIPASSAIAIAGGSSPDTYIVKSGDTLGAIASTLNVSVSDLAAANNNVNPQSLQIGQALKIPRPVPSATPASSIAAQPGAATPAAGGTPGVFPIQATGGAPSGSPLATTIAGSNATGTPSRAGGTPDAASVTEYTVQSKDTACAIAKANDVSLQELATANGMTKDQIAKLSIGQLLKIPPRSGHRDC